MRGDSITCRCEVDDWEFHPRYTDGACPLCGWRPADVTTEPPLAQRITELKTQDGIMVARVLR